jgi:serine-type D-Ala-D-Ala carboxypeptidase (penicillin-binding protein 5/6)
MAAPSGLVAARMPSAAPGGPVSAKSGTSQPQHRRRHHRRRRRLFVTLLCLAVLLALAAVAAVRLHAAPPVAAVTATMSTQVDVPPASTPVALPWPAAGQSAVAVPAIGIDVTSGPEQAVPIASLTKMMTAYLILRDHPLQPGENGPDITMTQADLDDFETATVTDQANAQVAVGEVLTEHQLLEGLLVHSANNFAETLARWDAGDVTTFVAKMNAAAQQLGMHNTHYADPSGFDQGSQSTAGDLLKVASQDMENPAFASIVKMSSVTLPVAGTISTYTPWLGFQGVIGVKSGFTTAAGGCDVVAVVRRAHGKNVMILAAVTGQTGPEVLDAAGYLALKLADQVGVSIGSVPLVRAGDQVANVRVAGHTVSATAASNVTMLSWPGVSAQRQVVRGRTVRAGAKAGTRVGSVVVGLGTQRAVIPVRLKAPLPQPTMLQRLF